MPSANTSRVRWFLVFWLFVLSAVSYLDRVNFSIAGGAIVHPILFALAIVALLIFFMGRGTRTV